jgi:hypothetical protein
MSDMPPVFEIHACSHDLTIYELDWTASDEAKSYAFTYGWVRASQARGLVEEIERLRARVAVLECVLRDARHNGLIYWEPKTTRAAVQRANMMSRIDFVLNKEAKP